MNFARCLLVMVFSAAPALAAAGVSTSGNFTAVWNNNLSRSSMAADRREAEALSASGSLSRRFLLTRDVSLLASGTAAAMACPQFDGLDGLSAAGQLEIRRKFGLGALAPVLSLQTELGGGTFRESARNTWTTTAKAELAKRFDDAWRLAFSGEWTQRHANDRVYSRINRGVSVELSWDATAIWQVAAGIGRQWGEQEANASWNTWGFVSAGGAGPERADYYARSPWILSDTFGPGWVAYRIDGRTDLWWVSLAPAVARNTAVPLRYERVEVRGGAGTRYVSDQVTLSLIHRF